MLAILRTLSSCSAPSPTTTTSIKRSRRLQLIIQRGTNNGFQPRRTIASLCGRYKVRSVHAASPLVVCKYAFGTTTTSTTTTTTHGDHIANNEVGMVHVTINEATEMTRKALCRIGWDDHSAKVQADIMVAAELCGNNQGLVKMYQPNLMAPSSLSVVVNKPIITRETAISAVIDAQQLPGMIAAITASDMVVQKVISSKLPIAIVCTHNTSTSSGQLAYYVERIAHEHNMIGIAMCNSPEFVAAAPGAKPVFGTNPIAVSIPLADSPYPYTVRPCESSFIFRFHIGKVSFKFLTLLWLSRYFI
jgi:Malate/L-lactate dehydrogenase